MAARGASADWRRVPVAEAQPVAGPGGAGGGSRSGRNLALRTASAAVLIPLALAAVWLGGWAFAALAFVATALVLVEWRTVTDTAMGPVETGLSVAGLSFVAILATLGAAGWAVALLGVMALFAGLSGRNAAPWRAGGVLYAGLPLVAFIVLRADPAYGLAATAWLFAIVWATDIGAFAAGRLIGGPKLWPRVSPGKTWAGFAGGTAAAGLVAAAAAGLIAGAGALPLLALGVALALVAQAGDLFESAVKRRFGVKDSGRLIPGHGGAMDRLDSLIAAGLAAALTGSAHAGVKQAAAGLLLW